MSVTPSITPGTALPTLSSAVPFTVTATPADLSVLVSFPSDAQSPKRWEVAYFKGTFADQYRYSTLAGSTFSIVRVDGWPSVPSFSVDEPSPAVPVAALLTVGYASALAQWSCHRSGTGMDTTDRSGNGYALGASNPVAAADLIPGKAALCPRGNGSAAAPATLSRATTAAFVITGEVTILARVALFGYNFPGTGGYVVSYSNAADGSAAGNCQWSMVLEQSGLTTSRLIYFAQTGAGKTAQLAYSNTVTLSDGLWHFCCIRRNSAGTVVDVQVDADTKQTTGLVAPTGGSTAFLRLGGTTNATPVELLGGLQADVNVFNARLSDGQVAAARVIMMGL